MTDGVKQAVIMVGGLGTRLRPLTETRPKPILPILDKPCLSYLIESLVKAGISEIILACGYRSDMLEATIGDGSAFGVSIVYSYEDLPKGTAGAMKQVENRLDDTFVAVNGDTFVDVDIKKELDVHFKTGATITLALTHVKNPCEFGIARVDDDGRILEFKEKPAPEEVFSDLVNAGIYVVEKKVLADVPPNKFYDFSKDLLPVLMKKREKIQSYMLEGMWKDVGRPMDLIGINLTLATRYYDDYLWGSKNLISSKINKPFYMGERTVIDSSEISAGVILKDSSVIGSKIINSFVMAGCVIDSAHIENSIIGEGCKIMPGARISNTIVGDKTVVGEGQIITGKV